MLVMADLQWFEGYTGQSTEDLLALEGTYRIDSLVLAFEEGIGQKATAAGDDVLTSTETAVLAVEALERVHIGHRRRVEEQRLATFELLGRFPDPRRMFLRPTFASAARQPLGPP